MCPRRSRSISTTLWYTVTQCSLKSYVHTVAFEVKACSALERQGRCWQWWQKLSKNNFCGPTVFFLECTLDPVVWNGVVDFANGESMTQNTMIYSTLIECFVYANVELLMILVDVSMQTCNGVVAKLVEHVDDVAKASTAVSATVPCPVGNITRSRWDLCGPKDMAVKS